MRSDEMTGQDDIMEPPGALALWREEIRRGRAGQNAAGPSSWRDDALCRAACFEISGIEARSAGLRKLAALWFGRAESEIMSAAEGKRAGRVA